MLNQKIIKNRDQLETSSLRKIALDIIEAGIESVLPSTIMQSAVSFFPESSLLSINREQFKLTGRLFVIGGGKASGLMGEMLEKITGTDVIEDGIVVDKAESSEFQTRKIRVLQAGHPLPDARGVAAVNEILSLKQKYSISREDIILCLISGGGSSLLPFPMEGISLEEKQDTTRLLLSCGASINEINSVRKHLSGIKGGRLARYFAPAKVISLILSDVTGNDLSVIASGMTYPDDSTFQDAYAVLEKYNILDRIPDNVRSVLQRGCRGEIEETPKTLDNARNYIIGDLRIALESMAAKSRSLGFNPLIITSEQKGETTSIAFQRAQEILSSEYSGFNALLIGGETTPVLPARHGKGGRNQHYAACTLMHFKGYTGEWAMASAGTDGSDFMPEVAGAIVDNKTLETLSHNVPDINRYIEYYDSNSLLGITGNSLIITGNTHTNVGDVILYLFPDGIRPA